jgi:hypothetical protein
LACSYKGRKREVESLRGKEKERERVMAGEREKERSLEEEGEIGNISLLRKGLNIHLDW